MTSIVTRRDDYNNTGPYYNGFPGASDSFSGTLQPGTTAEYSARSVDIPLLSVKKEPKKEGTKDNPGLGYEVKSNLTMISSNYGQLNASNIGIRAGFYYATRMYDCKIWQLGSKLQMFGSYNYVTNGAINGAATDIAVNSFDLYLNDIGGAKVDFSCQYYANWSQDGGSAAGASALYNGMYGLSRNVDCNKWSRVNLSMPVSDVINGGRATFETYYKQDLQDPNNNILGLGLYSMASTREVAAKNAGGFSLNVEKVGDDWNAAGGVKFGVGKGWSLNSTVFVDKIINEYNRSYGVFFGFGGATDPDSWIGKIVGKIPVAINFILSYYNMNPAQNPVKKELWTSEPYQFAEDFKYDPYGGPMQVTYEINLGSPDVQVHDGQKLELVIFTQNPGDKQGVVVTYPDPSDPTKDVVADINADIYLKRVVIYDMGVAPNDVMVDDINTNNATLKDDTFNETGPAKCTFVVKDPLNIGVKRYKIVIYCTADTSNLGEIGSLPGIKMSATIMGKMYRLEQ